MRDKSLFSKPSSKLSKLHFYAFGGIKKTSDWLNLNMPRNFSTKRINKINKIFLKHNLKVNSTFTGAYTRLNHLAHPDKSHQEYWVKFLEK